MSRRDGLFACVLALSVLPAAWADDEKAAKAAPPEKAVETFDKAWEIVQRTHYDPKLNGVDWDKIKAELRPKAEAAKTTEELRGVIREMLDRLGESHFALLPRETVDRLEAKPTSKVAKPTKPRADGEPPANRPRELPGEPPAQGKLKPATDAARPVARDAQDPAKPADKAKAEPGKKDTAQKPHDDRGDAGFDVRVLDGRLVVTSVAANGPAAKAGVRPGWILNSVNGESMDKLLKLLPRQGVNERVAAVMAWRTGAQRLHGPVGSTVRLECLDGDDQTVQVELKRRREPGEVVKFGHLPPLPADLETERVQTEAGRTVGVIRFNVWLAPLAPAFDKAVDAFRNADGIVIDLRGNPGGVGGMAVGFAGHFLDKPASLGTMKLRTAEMKFAVNPRRVSTTSERVEPYRGPLAVLTDQGSLSTSEIFAGGLQALGRARVFGQTTGGAALPSQMEKLPNGDVLQHAIADFTTSNGRRLEGNGVVPDQAVPLTRADLLTGRDPVLHAALAWIDAQKEKK
jgi:carboxyl-terminal processing protease